MFILLFGSFGRILRSVAMCDSKIRPLLFSSPNTFICQTTMFKDYKSVSGLSTVKQEIFVCRKILRFSQILRHSRNFPACQYYLQEVYNAEIREIFLSRTSRRREFAKISCHENFLFYSIPFEKLCLLHVKCHPDDWIFSEM